MRKEVWKFLPSKVPKIHETSSTTKLATLSKHKTLAIQELNTFIARKYKQTMAELSQYCDGVIGKAPCVYTIVGMGSLAREDITTYSDFELIILLFNDENYKFDLQYFKRFSVIFHIVVLNI